MTNEILKNYLKRQLHKARAEGEWEWRDLVVALNHLGFSYTVNSLSTKFSRGTFRAQELILLLKVMEVNFLDLSLLELPGLKEAIRAGHDARQERHPPPPVSEPDTP